MKVELISQLDFLMLPITKNKVDICLRKISFNNIWKNKWNAKNTYSQYYIAAGDSVITPLIAFL